MSLEEIEFKPYSLKEMKDILEERVKHQKVKPKILKERINETEKIILKLVENGELTSGELYGRYCEIAKNPLSERSFRDFVNHLSEIGFKS